ncbi:MAG: DUF711 family protein [Acidilobaceae archaeon]|nr:DUF711 family protein [Acidilobaceae archaeon]MCX8165865.1 DUF711 family protein [Acidilobaceae archaeon]MDW7974873.1 DUF711 family protein [Sulfolobales archaeon]
MGFKYQIRALVYHAPAGWGEGELEEVAAKLAEGRERVEREIGIKVWSLRLTLPQAFERVDEIGETGDALVSLGNLPASHPKLEELVGSAVREGFYVGVLLDEASWSSAIRVSQLIHKLSEESPDLATRLGVNALGEPLLTPYYPLSYSSGEGGVSAALLYPNYLRDSYQEGGLPAVKAAVREAAKVAKSALNLAAEVLGTKALGVDLSVSPWMEESSLGLVEAVAGTRLPRPGFALGVRRVNEALEEVARETGAIGFNEVQLPLGEDSRLKARASEGEVTARDLLRLSGVSLAGLDLVVVPANVNEVAGLLLDAAAYARAKGKALGVRIIPVEEVEPGDGVLLSRFGEVPVIPI